jgi:hypothetical protein
VGEIRPLRNIRWRTFSRPRARIFFTTNPPVPSETVITRKILIAALFHLFLPVQKKRRKFKFGFFPASNQMDSFFLNLVFLWFYSQSIKWRPRTAGDWDWFKEGEKERQIRFVVGCPVNFILFFFNFKKEKKKKSFRSIW